MIEADPVAAAVRAVMEERTEWKGTATDLLGALAEAAGERVAKSKIWPASPRALSGRLRRAATFLRKIGIEIDHVKEGQARTRIIHIKAGGNSGAPDYRGLQPSAPSASSANSPKGNGTNVFAENNRRTVGDLADAKADAGQDDAGLDRPRQTIEIRRYRRCGRKGRKISLSIRFRGKGPTGLEDDVMKGGRGPADSSGRRCRNHARRRRPGSRSLLTSAGTRSRRPFQKQGWDCRPAGSRWRWLVSRRLAGLFRRAGRDRRV